MTAGTRVGLALVALTAWALAPAAVAPVSPATASPHEQPHSVAAPSGIGDASVGGPVARVDARSVCDQLNADGQAVTAVTPAQSASPLSGDDNTPLYAGTTLTVVFCNADGEPADPNTWSLADHDGYTIENSDSENDQYRIELAPQQTTLAFADLVERRDPETGFTIEVTVGAVVNSELADDPLSFDSQSAAEEYADSEKRFVNAVETVETEAAAVNESAAEIREQGLTAAEPNATLNSLSEVRSKLTATANAHTRLVYRETFSGSMTTDLLEATDTQRREANASAATALVAYQRAVTERTAQHRSDIRRAVGLGFLPGLVVGTLVGVLVPYRRKRKVDYDRKFTKSAGGSQAFLVPAVVAVLALAVGLALLWLTLPLGLVIA